MYSQICGAAKTMTNLTKPVRRVSAGRVFDAGKMRPVVVTLEPPCVLKFRAKGCKRNYSLTIAACYIMAVKAHVSAEKRLKKEKKKKGKVKAAKVL